MKINTFSCLSSLYLSFLIPYFRTYLSDGSSQRGVYSVLFFLEADPFLSVGNGENG
jgi:hypothetical protein